MEPMGTIGKNTSVVLSIRADRLYLESLGEQLDELALANARLVAL